MIGLRSNQAAPYGVIAGNWLGYDSNGNSVSSSLTTGYSISHFGSSNYFIGTDGNSIGDNLEGNWFGCSKQGMVNQQSTAGSLTIAGNFFGFPTTVLTGTTLSGNCLADHYIDLSAAAPSVIG